MWACLSRQGPFALLASGSHRSQAGRRFRLRGGPSGCRSCGCRLAATTESVRLELEVHQPPEAIVVPDPAGTDPVAPAIDLAHVLVVGKTIREADQRRPAVVPGRDLCPAAWQPLGKSAQ